MDEPSKNGQSNHELEGIGGQPIVDSRTSVKDLRLLQRAARHKWPVKNHHRKLVVNQMEDILKNADDPRTVVAAARVLIAADSVNIHRETNEVAERTADIAEGIAVLRAAMAGKELREQFAKDTDSLPGNP